MTSIGSLCGSSIGDTLLRALSTRLKNSRRLSKTAWLTSFISGFLSHQETCLIIGMPAVVAARGASISEGPREGERRALGTARNQGLILFLRSERAKSNPRSIDTLEVPFPAVLTLESCDFAAEKCGCFRGSKTAVHFSGKVLDLDSGGWGAGAKRRQGLVEQAISSLMSARHVRLTLPPCSAATACTQTTTL